LVVNKIGRAVKLSLVFVAPIPCPLPFCLPALGRGNSKLKLAKVKNSQVYIVLMECYIIKLWNGR
jgi:hypothetical protein